MAWTLDGMLLALGLADGTVSLRDKAGTEKNKFAASSSSVWSLAWSPGVSELLQQQVQKQQQQQQQLQHRPARYIAYLQRQSMCTCVQCMFYGTLQLIHAACKHHWGGSRVELAVFAHLCRTNPA